MKFTIKTNDKVQIKNYGKQIDVAIPLDKAYMQECEYFTRIKPDTYYSVEIKRISGKKTKSQNDYAWELITAISHGKTPYIEPIEVYRSLAKDFAPFDIMAVSNEALDSYIRRWQQNGKAWFCEVLDRSEKWTKIKQTYGMSVWSKEELSQFIDILKDECRVQRIPTERFEDG